MLARMSRWPKQQPRSEPFRHLTTASLGFRERVRDIKLESLRTMPNRDVDDMKMLNGNRWIGRLFKLTIQESPFSSNSANEKEENNKVIFASWCRNEKNFAEPRDLSSRR